MTITSIIIVEILYHMTKLRPTVKKLQDFIKESDFELRKSE